MAIIIGAVAVVTVAVAFGTLAVQRRNATRTIELDRELAMDEAVSGKCAACAGQGYRWTATGGVSAGGGAQTCWRCGGSGLPPTPEDRARFMPSDRP